MRSRVSQVSLHKLEVFCLVVELNSVSRAAEYIGIAQPVVSAHVKALASHLGVSLTVRSGRRVMLTEEGHKVYRWARDLVSRTREFEREIAEFQRGVVGKATIGASMTFGSYVLPSLVADFHALFPKGQISVRVMNPAAVTDAIRSGDCDVAYTILDPHHDLTGLDVKTIMHERLVLVVSEHSTVAPSGLALQDLSTLSFIAAQSGTARREIEDDALARIGIEREHIHMEFGHAEAIKQAVRTNAGAAFLFLSSVRDELAAGTLSLVEVPELQLRVPVYRVSRKGRAFSTFQTSLMEHLSRSLEEEVVSDP